MRGETHRCRNDSSPEVGFAIRIKSRYYLTSLYHINITALLLLSEIQMNPIRKHVPTATASLGTRTCAIHATERKCSHSYPPRKEFQCNLSAAETRLTAAVYPSCRVPSLSPPSFFANRLSASRRKAVTYWQENAI